MSDKCNPTGAWFETSYVFKALDQAETNAKLLYEEKLSNAVNKLIGSMVLVPGMRGWLFRQKRAMTREDAEKAVREDGFGWGSTEYWLRIRRDKQIDGIEALRYVARTAEAGDRKQMFVGKADMEYMN